MIQSIKTDLFAARAPLEWAVMGNGIFFTTQIPIDKNGSVVKGGIEAQVRQTLANLNHTLSCVPGGEAHLAQLIIYVTKRDDLQVVNKVYPEFIEAPYPNRAAIIVNGFARPEILIEVIAYAVFESD